MSITCGPRCETGGHCWLPASRTAQNDSVGRLNVLGDIRGDDLFGIALVEARVRVAGAAKADEHRSRQDRHEQAHQGNGHEELDECDAGLAATGTGAHGWTSSRLTITRLSFWPSELRVSVTVSCCSPLSGVAHAVP